MRQSGRVTIADDMGYQDMADSMRGETEPMMRCATTQEFAPMSEDDIDTWREIRVALEAVESERPSGPDIETCISPDRRSEFPAAEVYDGASLPHED